MLLLMTAMLLSAMLLSVVLLLPRISSFAAVLVAAAVLRIRHVRWTALEIYVYAPRVLLCRVL